ncbi:helix-turn-helix transcriptional regulator [Pseudomonas sp. Z5-35]
MRSNKLKQDDKSLTLREHEIFKLLLKGDTNKTIALALGISDFTVRDHVSSILRKKKASTRAALLAQKIINS